VPGTAAAPTGEIGAIRGPGAARACERQNDGVDIRANSVLPARRQDIELHTADGLTLVGELALPRAVATVRTSGSPTN
jgi:hypothetical protein